MGVQGVAPCSSRSCPPTQRIRDGSSSDKPRRIRFQEIEGQQTHYRKRREVCAMAFFTAFGSCASAVIYTVWEVPSKYPRTSTGQSTKKAKYMLVHTSICIPHTLYTTTVYYMSFTQSVSSVVSLRCWGAFFYRTCSNAARPSLCQRDRLSVVTSRLACVRHRPASVTGPLALMEHRPAADAAEPMSVIYHQCRPWAKARGNAAGQDCECGLEAHPGPCLLPLGVPVT
mmetsp:Transcript_71795/g.126462  ORF Transcript_71795/g.126462 Transcript_71795/m.126462 type:complete len:228 (+) Transcript_71795:307-990(+)